jgi:hypothetical protein
MRAYPSALPALLLVCLASCKPAPVSPPPIGGGADGPAGDAFGLTIPEGGAAFEVSDSDGGFCVAELVEARQFPVDLLLLVDTSASMRNLSGTQSKWALVVEALRSFVGDSGSQGLGVGLTFFPNPPRPRLCSSDADCVGISPLPRGGCRPGAVCAGMPAGPPVRSCLREAGGASRCPAATTCMNVPGVCQQDITSCDRGDYERPALDIATVPGATQDLLAVLANQEPDGLTPTALAVERALAWLSGRLSTHPSRRPALVLATDGLPMGCTEESEDNAVARLSAGRSGPSPIPTYVIGVFGPTEIARAEPALRRFATAGGTGEPFLLVTGEDLSQRFLTALQAIRGAALACEYVIPLPPSGTLDYGKVNVHFESGGVGEDIVYVGGADRCGSAARGWHYDIDPASGMSPTRIVLCPATCAQFKAAAAGKVSLGFGCRTRIVD